MAPYAYEVKFFYKNGFEILNLPEIDFKNQCFSGDFATKQRENAFGYLQKTLKELIVCEILFFKNHKINVYEKFDYELIKDENGDFSLEKIHQFPMFLNNGIEKIALLFQGKEIFRIGNIKSFSEYQEIAKNSEEEYLIHLESHHKMIAFHLISFQKIYIFDKKIQEFLKILQTNSSEKENLWFSIPDYSIIEDFTLQNIEKHLLALHNSNGGVLFFKNVNASMSFQPEFDISKSIEFVRKIHPKIQVETDKSIDFELNEDFYEAYMIKKGNEVLKSSFGAYFFRNFAGIFCYDKNSTSKDLRNEEPMNIETIKEILKNL